MAYTLAPRERREVRGPAPVRKTLGALTLTLSQRERGSLEHG